MQAVTQEAWRMNNIELPRTDQRAWQQHSDLFHQDSAAHYSHQRPRTYTVTNMARLEFPKRVHISLSCYCASLCEKSRNYQTR